MIVGRAIRNGVIPTRTGGRRTVSGRAITVRVIAAGRRTIFTLGMPCTFTTRSRSTLGARTVPAPSATDMAGYIGPRN